MIRTLPAPERDRVPLFIRSKWTRVAAIAMTVGAAAGAILFAISSTHHGTGVRGTTPPGLSQVPLAGDAATAYDPFGDGSEHNSEAARALDGNPSTQWTTESYYSGLQKSGVGLALDAAPGVAARAVALRSPTPGFTASIWGANGDLPSSRVPGVSPAGGTPPSRPPTGWVRLSPDRTVRRSTTIRLTPAATKQRWYLIWINRLAPGQREASISEAVLLH